jgi:hypothetical protein
MPDSYEENEAKVAAENDIEDVANPGSTIGEAIGALIEREVNRLLQPIAEDSDCVYVAVGRPNPRTGKPTKLLLKDSAGNEYNIDSVIANPQMQPLVLVESKYIRYKKHNRDKGSWICTAHYSLRRSFPTIRKSVAVIAGSWSASSKAMMESFDVDLFEVGFAKIAGTLADYNVDIRWGEKERDRVIAAWQRWQQLTEEEYSEIARRLLEDIEPTLRTSISATLNTAVPREVREVEVTIETNLGESRRYTFNSISEAIEFLDNFDEEIILNETSGPTLWAIESSAQATSDEDANN